MIEDFSTKFSSPLPAHERCRENYQTPKNFCNAYYVNQIINTFCKKSKL